MPAKYKLHTGNCVDVLRDYPDESFDAIVTDPPYELGFMGKGWDSAGVAYDQSVWAEMLRVLAPGGHLLAFGGTRTYHRMACAIEDAGFEIRDSINWIYGSGFPKSHNLKDEWEGWGTALKPAHEPIVVARKPLIGTVAANVLEYGTGALNIDGSRVGHVTVAGGNLALNPHLRQTIRGGNGGHVIAHETEVREGSSHDAGRWPANLVLTHHPDCRPAGTAEETVGGGEAGTSGFAAGYESGDGFVGRTVGATVWDCHPECPAAVMDGQSGVSKGTARTGPPGGKTFGGSEMRAEVGTWFGDAGGASRYFTQTTPDLDGPSFLYQAKANKQERNAGLNDPNPHPTVKPVAVMEWLVRLVTPPDGVVLDPFMGSGTTGIAAIRLGFDFVGIDMTPEYVEIAEHRINHASSI